MKKKLLIGFIVILSFINAAHADFIFHSDRPNACENITGVWVGSGKASNWLLNSCEYKGSGTISDLDRNGNFKVHVTGYKTSGSPLCPKHGDKELVGICTNGFVRIITDNGDLTGSFSNNAGSIKGTLTIALGITATVTGKFLHAQ